MPFRQFRQLLLVLMLVAGLASGCSSAASDDIDVSEDSSSGAAAYVSSEADSDDSSVSYEDASDTQEADAEVEPVAEVRSRPARPREPVTPKVTGTDHTHSVGSVDLARQVFGMESADCSAPNRFSEHWKCVADGVTYTVHITGAGEENFATEGWDPYANRAGNQIEADGASADFCDTHSCIDNFDEGQGSVAMCSDGTYTQSGGIQGACSHHGGLARSSTSSSSSSYSYTPPRSTGGGVTYVDPYYRSDGTYVKGHLRHYG
jgi:hypothetical protein